MRTGSRSCLSQVTVSADRAVINLKAKMQLVSLTWQSQSISRAILLTCLYVKVLVIAENKTKVRLSKAQFEKQAVLKGI